MGRMRRFIKQAAIGALTLAMLAGSATAAFADDNNKGKGKGNNKGNEKRYEQQDKRNVQTIRVEHSGTIRIQFTDLDDADVSWAARYIASLASKQVFDGYEDGTFKPRSPVKRIEAITAAVRLMGLRGEAESAEAMNTDLNFKDAKQVPDWAVGYVAVALKNDLFTETESSVHPNQPADRLWATTLLVKALKLDDEVRAKMNTKLPFKDAKNIPAGSVGYVAVALEKGLIDGFEDNTFRPNQPVTRAQLAALLDRTGEQLPDYDKNTAVGTVAVPVAGNVLTITKDGASRQILLDPNAFVFRNGARVSFSALQPGDEVQVKLFNDIGVYVEVTKLAPTNPNVDFSLSGRLYSLEWNNGKITKIGVNTAASGSSTPVLTYYNVDPNYSIVGNAAQLVYDRNIEVQGKNQVVTKIIVK